MNIQRFISKIICKAFQKKHAAEQKIWGGGEGQNFGGGGNGTEWNCAHPAGCHAPFALIAGSVRVRGEAAAVWAGFAGGKAAELSRKCAGQGWIIALPEPPGG